MKNKIRITSIFIIMTAALLTACGPSDEKLMELETEKGIMLEAKESAEETYLDITDSSMEERLNKLDNRVNEIVNTDYSKTNDAKVDEAVLEIKEITEEYQSLQNSFDEVLKKETEEKAEAEKYMGVSCYLINKTGMNLTSVVLHDITQDGYSDNLLGNDMVLNSGYTLMGVVLEINRSSSEFEFIITNENNTSFTLSCDDLSSLKIDETAITLRYDSETKTGTVSLFGDNA